MTSSGLDTWPYPRLIAHRGGGLVAPENTLAAIRAAYEAGYVGVEFDVMLSADGTPFLIHDESLERTTNGTGLVAGTRDAVLRTLDAGAWHSPRYSGEPVPTLPEALAVCEQLGLWANVEIKPAAGTESITGQVVASCVAAWLNGTAKSGMKPLLSSFSEASLLEASVVAPDLPRGLLFEAPPSDAIARAVGLGCVSLHVDWRHIGEDLIAQARAAGLALVAYTVNVPGHVVRLLASGVCAVITDRLDAIDPETGADRTRIQGIAHNPLQAATDP